MFIKTLSEEFACQLPIKTAVIYPCQYSLPVIEFSCTRSENWGSKTFKRPLHDSRSTFFFLRFTFSPFFELKRVLDLRDSIEKDGTLTIPRLLCKSKYRSLVEKRLKAHSRCLSGRFKSASSSVREIVRKTKRFPSSCYKSIEWKNRSIGKCSSTEQQLRNRNSINFSLENTNCTRLSGDL